MSHRPPPPPATATVGGRVTAVSVQVGDHDRVSVFVDGVFAFGLDRELALQEGIRVDIDIDPARIEALRGADETVGATNAALRLLSYRPRTEREVRDRLRQKGYAEATIELVVERLHGWRYLDDAAFARAWVENREANRPRGRHLLEQELRRKGVASEVVRETIDAADLVEADAVETLVRAKLRGGAYAELPPAVARRRLAGFLTRRGYGYDVVRPVLDRLLGETGDPDDRASEGEEPDEGS